MNIYSVIPLITALAFIPLFAILLGNRPWEKRHRLLLLYLIPVILWSLVDFLFRSDFLMEHKLLLVKLTLWIGLWSAIQFMFIIRAFSGVRFIKIPIIYILLIVTAILEVLDYVPKSIEISADSIHVSYGILFILIVVILLAVICKDLYFLIRRLIVSVNMEERNQIGYLLFGTSALAITAFLAFTPAGGRLPLAHVGGLINACTLTYVVLKHQLLDLRLIARRGLGVLGMATAGTGAYLLLFFLIYLLADTELNAGTLALTTGLAVAVGVIMYAIRDFFIRRVDRLFYKERYDYRHKLYDFIKQKLSGVFSLNELGEELLPLLAGSLRCRKIDLLLPESSGSALSTVFSYPQDENSPKLSIKLDSPILEQLKRERKYLSKEDLDILPEFRGLWEKERDTFRTLGIELLFPIVSRSNLIGIFAFNRKKSGRYSLEDIGFIETVIGEVATSLEKEYLQEQLKKQKQELSLINQLAAVISSSLNIQEVYDTFVAGLKNVVDVDWATIALIEGDNLHFQALSSQIGSPWQTGDSILLKGTATEWLSVHKRSVIEPDLQQKHKFSTGNELANRGIRSAIYLPLTVKGETIGSLSIASCRVNAYNQEHVRLLERLALQIAVPVENSRLYAKSEQRARVDELTSLFNRRHFDECIGHEIDRHSRYGTMLSLILLDLDFFKDYNDSQGHLAGDKMLAQVGHLINRSVRNPDMAFRYGGDEFAILLPQSSSDNAYVVAERIRSKIAGKTANNHIKISASLGLASWPNDGVTQDEIVNAADKALYYAKQTGGDRTCVASKMLPPLSETIELRANNEKEALSTVYALAATIEARDQYTYGHSRKVSRYAVALAEALGLPSDRVAIVGTAALLQDIGKIGVPDEVLNKEDTFTDEEWELVRSHPRISANIVGYVPSLTPCLSAILHHQEHWDGTGYPDSLKGEAIPLEARILAISDAFDAMTSPRPHRGPLSSNKALKELKRGAGSQFDPDLVEVFQSIAPDMITEEIRVG